MSSEERYEDLVDSGAGGESVLHRAVSLLSAFDSRHDRLSLGALVLRSGLPKTTVHRLAQELARLGLLARDGSAYTVGDRVLEFASLAPARRALREAALPYMEDLYEATHETIHLAIVSNGHVLYVEKINGHRRIAELTRVGGRMPLHSTSLGKAIMAFSPPELLESAIEAGLAPMTTATITSPRLLRHEVRETASRGVAYDREEGAVGLCCTGAPILDSMGEAVAAISVSGPASRLRLDRVGIAVRAAALGASRELRRLTS